MHNMDENDDDNLHKLLEEGLLFSEILFDTTFENAISVFGRKH
jgi:hypothetical protein